jgi:hypothetical protein
MNLICLGKIMSIREFIIELKEINTERTRLRLQLRQLNEYATACEKNIIQFLDAGNHPGVTFKGLKISRQTIKKRQRPNKTERRQMARIFLEKFGVVPTDLDLEGLFETLRGPLDESQSRVKLE